MTQRWRTVGRPSAMILTVAALSGCAAAVRQPVEISKPAPSNSAQVALGVVASIRVVSISGAQVGSIAGLNAVLGALSQQRVGPPLAGEEVVIRKDDGNTAAIVEQDQTASVSAGDRVALIQTSPAMIIRRN